MGGAITSIKCGLRTPRILLILGSFGRWGELCCKCRILLYMYNLNFNNLIIQ